MFHFALFILSPLLGIVFSLILLLRFRTMQSRIMMIALGLVMFQFLTEPVVFRWMLDVLPMSVNYVFRVLIYTSFLSPLILGVVLVGQLLRHPRVVHSKIRI